MHKLEHILLKYLKLIKKNFKFKGLVSWRINLLAVGAKIAIEKSVCSW